MPNDRATRRESGSKLTALQTLREDVRAPVGAKRLECVRLAGAFPIVRPIHNSEMRPAENQVKGKYCQSIRMWQFGEGFLSYEQT